MRGSARNPSASATTQKGGDRVEPRPDEPAISEAERHGERSDRRRQDVRPREPGEPCRGIAESDLVDQHTSGCVSDHRQDKEAREQPPAERSGSVEERPAVSPAEQRKLDAAIATPDAISTFNTAARVRSKQGSVMKRPSRSRRAGVSGQGSARPDRSAAPSSRAIDSGEAPPLGLIPDRAVPASEVVGR